jgi:hypothetical protein
MAFILDYPLIGQYIVPFVLVFVLIFAILQKSKILGDGKSQMDALISLVIALILIITPPARDFIVKLMPWLAVGLSVMLVFLILYGAVAGESWASAKWVKIVFGILSGIFVIVIVLWAAGVLNQVGDFFSNGLNGTWMNIILVVIIIGVVVFVALSGKNGSSGKSDK